MRSTFSVYHSEACVVHGGVVYNMATIFKSDKCEMLDKTKRNDRPNNKEITMENGRRTHGNNNGK